jgi:hypothetical protein
VKFLRRAASSTDTAEVDENEAAEVSAAGAITARKGRPTPKRREAQGKRGPVAPPPRTQREAFKRMKENRPDKDDRRQAAAKRREGLMSGEDKYLMPRDRGPVRAYVRDLVDSRRHIAGLMMPLAALVLVSLFIPVYNVQSIISLILMVMMLAIVVEGIFLSRSINARTRAKFPNENIRGLGTGMYVVMRATQPRRLRAPRPRVAPGATI